VLGAREIQVWLGRPAAFDSHEGILSPDEKERLARFRFAKDRRLALASRALVRRSLSRCVDVPPEAWRFDLNPHGRPEIIAPATVPKLRFNASNTHGLVVCAVVWERDIGVDAEGIPPVAPLDVADTHFAPVERVALRALAPADQARRFAEIWTLKEAYIKARGLGLSLALDGFAFHLTPGESPRLTIDVRLSDDAPSWQLALFTPTPEHCAALCVRRGAEPSLDVVERWDDGQLT
jgi:4'-phosphopantetheinyl transferase